MELTAADDQFLGYLSISFYKNAVFPKTLLGGDAALYQKLNVTLPYNKTSIRRENLMKKIFNLALMALIAATVCIYAFSEDVISNDAKIKSDNYAVRIIAKPPTK